MALPVELNANESGEQERLEELELFGPGLIHEMRHPLMGIKAGLELVARRLPQVAGAEEWEMVTTQVARLEEMFRSYQDLFAPARIAPTRFPLEPVLQRAVDLVAYRLRRLGTSFTWAASRPLEAHGAPTAVLHAVINLLVNAVDAVEERGQGRVELRVLEGPLEIRISDEGPGISDENIVRLFEARFTTKPPGKGTGLGLHIARKAMMRTGGQVRLVLPGDPRRRDWARTEFAVEVPQA